MSEVSESGSGYAADAALVDAGDDRLLRKPFAQRIAQTIAKRSDKASLVVGLYGRWGEGKTTVLNFINGYLKEQDDIVVVRFNPWLFQDERQLLLSFFETLADAIEHNLTSKTEDIGKWLRMLGGALGTVSVGFGPVTGAPAAAMQTVGVSLSSVDLAEKRERLEQALSEANKRVVILIDDIDRLDNTEIATIFKLVKQAADFDYTSYILAFDRDVVAQALAAKYAGSDATGSSFIEKIVQVPLELPRADPAVLQSMTVEAIDQSIQSSGVEVEDLDLSRFSMIFYRNLASYIGTPRMAKRLANAIEFAVPLVASEVNLADLLILEFVRVLFPPIYKRMPLFKEYLLGRPFDIGIGNDAEAVVRGKLDEMLEGLDGNLKSDISAALRELFPRIERLFTNYHYGPESIPGWRAEQRICAPEYFDRFFSYGIPLGDSPDADFRGFLSRLGSADVTQAATSLRELIALSSAERVVQKLRSVETDFDSDSARILILAVSEASDVFPNPANSSLTNVMTPFTQAAMHVASLTQRLPSSERAGIIENAIVSSPSLPFASEILRWAHVLSGDDVVQEERVLTEEEIVALQVVLAHRVAETASVSPLFTSMPTYAPTLYYDWLRGDEVAVRAHLEGECQGSFENSLALVRAFMPTSWSMQTGLPLGSSVHRNTYDSIAGLMDPQVIVDSFASRFPSVLQETTVEETVFADEPERIVMRFIQIHRVVQGEDLAETPDDVDEPGTD